MLKIRVKWLMTAICILWGCVAANALAGEPIKLTRGASLSPDGQTIVFQWAGDLWTASSSGGAATQLTRHKAEDRDPCFSPDGTEIAFTSNRGGSHQIYTMPATGGPAVQVSHHSEDYRLIDYTPDGNSFFARMRRDHYWYRGDRFFIVDGAGKVADQLVFDAACGSGGLSPDGKRVLFTREGTRWSRKGYRGPQASQIWHYDRSTGDFEKLLHDDMGYRYPVWKRDASGFYYVGQQSGSFNLWEYDFATRKKTQITFFPDNSVLAPVLSLDGSTLVFQHLFDLYRLDLAGGGTPEVVALHNDGEPVAKPEMRRNLDSATEVAFSSDGLEVAFIAGGDIWVMDTELREPKQVTQSPEEERDLVFAPDNESLLFVSDAGGQTDLWTASRANEDAYWWQNEEFTLTALTQDEVSEAWPTFSPDGSKIAYIRGNGDLMLMLPDGSEPEVLLSSWDGPYYDWSPDSKWIVYSVDDNDFNSDVWVMSLEDRGAPVNISTHPDNDYRPTWSPDGRVIAFTGRRRDQEVDIYYIWLRKEDDQRDSRDRKLEKAIEKMAKKRKTKKSDEPAAETDADEDEEEKPKRKGGRKKSKKEREIPEVIVDFDGIQDRMNRISIPDSRETGLYWIGDQKLAFTANIDGARGTYTVEFPSELRPKKLSSTVGSQQRWLRDSKEIVLLNSGKPSTMSMSGKAKAYPFRVRQTVDTAARYAAGFDQAWRSMRDSFYDERMGNRNWDAIRRKYADMASRSVDDQAFANVIQLMLGELNGSHLGFSARSRDYRHDQPWSPLVAHLGLRFDPDHTGPGWKVRDVLPEGPASQDSSKVHAGEVILKIDGVKVDPATREADALMGRIDRDIELEVLGTDQSERTVTIRPVTYGGARRLLYQHWIDNNRRRVSELSGNSLGYLHIRGMNWPSFLRFEEELYKIGAGKKGLVIDVRANGGGSTTDHLLTVLTQPDHAITVPRGGGQGYPQDRRVYATWNKPIVVLCDQNSFSNAEIFAHAIKGLGRGRLVGVQTAGGVISTGGRGIMDLGFLRMPFRGWYVLNTGEDMELNGAMPHIEVWPQPGALPSGRDRQLSVAVETLLEDVQEWEARPRPALRKASERWSGNRAELPRRKTEKF